MSTQNWASELVFVHMKQLQLWLKLSNAALAAQRPEGWTPKSAFVRVHVRVRSRDTLHKSPPRRPCSSDTYHGNQCRGQVKHRQPTCENTTADNKCGRLIHTSTAHGLSQPIDSLEENARTHTHTHTDRNTDVMGSVCPFLTAAVWTGSDPVTLWALEMNYLRLPGRRPQLRAQSDGVVALFYLL